MFNPDDASEKGSEGTCGVRKRKYTTKLGEKAVRNKSVVAFSGIFTPIAAEKNILSIAYVRENPLFLSYVLYEYLFNIFVLRKPIQLS